MAISFACNLGCLSIGGKTYTTQQNPQTENRLAALETRIDALEQAVMGSSGQFQVNPEAEISPGLVQ